jgi:hypothetical protein
MSVVFDRLAESRMCPECRDLLKLYVTVEGIQLLACMNCPFDLADQMPGEEAVLNEVRHMAARDRSEHVEHKSKVNKEPIV